VLQLLFFGELILLQSTSAGAFAGEPQAVTVANVVRSWDASGSFDRTSSRSDVWSFRKYIPYSPPAVGFRFLRWSVAGCNLLVVQFSCLFEPHAMGAIFCYRTFPVLGCACNFPSTQQAWRSFFRLIYVGGPLKGPQLTTTVDTLTPTPYCVLSLILFVN
jgi:hypothetical protein